MRPTLIQIAPGVFRLTWDADLRTVDLAVSVARIREALDRGFGSGAERIEVHVDPEDDAAHRVATWGGLQREGIARGVAAGADRVVYARLRTDLPVEEPGGFRPLLNSFLPRKRAISQALIRSTQAQVLLCQMTYKPDWDLPGGVVEVGESPQVAATREVEEELGLRLPPGPLLLTDWLPAWGGWDDAVCLVFDGGVHQGSLIESLVHQEREIKAAEFCTVEQVRERCADFTARRVEAALRSIVEGSGPAYTEGGH